MKNIPKVVNFIKSKFIPMPTLASLCDGLRLWEKITLFLIISTVKDRKDYEKKCQNSIQI